MRGKNVWHFTVSVRNCPLSYDQARCIQPTFCRMLCDPSVFYRIWSWLRSWWGKKFASSYNSFRPNHHSGYSLDREKHRTLLTLKWRRNVVYDVTNVEQHELLGFDASCPLPDVMPEQTNSLAVIEGVLSCFFQTTAAASTIGHVCRARSEIQTEKEQCVLCKQPGERELWEGHRAGPDLPPHPKAFGTGAPKRGHREEETGSIPAGPIARSRTPSNNFMIHHAVVMHLRNSGLNPAVSKTDIKNQWSTISKALDWSKLISQRI